MNTNTITSETLAASVIAVPPLARNPDLSLNSAENEKQIRHLEAGGVTTLLYGGNANLYHIRVSEYAELLGQLRDTVADNTVVIPAVGPAYGIMMDQADVLRDFDFPTVMVLPQAPVSTEAGFMTGFSRFVEALGKPAVLYIKDESFVSPEGAAELMDEGVVSFIKYAIPRDDPSDDDFLERLVDRVDSNRICSGLGEQPALIHMTRFRCAGYTSGCVCVNPALSQKMLRAIVDQDYDEAERIRRQFIPLEDLRNAIHPIRVLHEAVELAGIADTGPHLPFLSGVASSQRDNVQQAASVLKDV